MSRFYCPYSNTLMLLSRRYICNTRDMMKQMRLYRAIAEAAVPKHLMESLTRLARWDEDAEEWRLAAVEFSSASLPKLADASESTSQCSSVKFYFSCRSQVGFERPIQFDGLRHLARTSSFHLFVLRLARHRPRAGSNQLSARIFSASTSRTRIKVHITLSVVTNQLGLQPCPVTNCTPRCWR